MTDQGRSYGSEPWGQAGSYGGQGGYPPQAPYPYGPQPQQPYPYGQQPPAPQPPYGQPPYGQPQQPQYPGYPQGPYGTGQQPVYPGQPQPYPGQPQQPYPGRPGQPQQAPYGQQPPQRPRPQTPPPSGPGPDGIDWVAEAAKLEAESRGEAPTGEDDHEGYLSDEDVYVEEHDADEDEYIRFLSDDDSRSGRRKDEAKGRKERKRSGVACLGVTVLLLGLVGGGGYFGYKWYKNQNTAADFSGTGTTDVQVQIPDGATGWVIGNTLKAAGVVESAQAFVNAYNGDLKEAEGIQPGYYTLKLQMSAASALQSLVSQQGGNSLTIPEGMTTKWIYADIDKYLKLPAGTTLKAAQDGVAQLGLPAEAKGNPEGFLWPARYSISKGMKPIDLLQQMVANTKTQIQAMNLDTAGQGVKLDNAYDVLKEASILQAEGNNVSDFGKIARVLYNRLNTNVTWGRLELDTPLQYYLGSKTFTNAQKATSAGGYNTYVVKGLPPTPIDNPGQAAIQAVLNPTPGNWAYFVAVDTNDTRFSATWSQFLNDVQAYCAKHGENVNRTSGQCQ